jgi:hypothetical protein
MFSVLLFSNNEVLYLNNLFYFSPKSIPLSSHFLCLFPLSSFLCVHKLYIILSWIFLPFDVEINNYSVIAVRNYMYLSLHVFWSFSGLQTPEKWRRSSQPPRRTLWSSSLRKRPPSLARYRVRILPPLCLYLQFGFLELPGLCFVLLLM